jgi:RHS repeat-associated protein
MSVTNYYSINGEIIGEKVGAAARTDYLTDALGSVTSTLNQSAQAVNTYRYKPYGAQLAKTGIGTDPALRWVGSHGYRQTDKKYSDVYVRARHYDDQVGRWTTNDPMLLQDDTNRYLYANASPILIIDPTGLQALGGLKPPPSKYDGPACCRCWTECKQIKDPVKAAECFAKNCVEVCKLDQGSPIQVGPCVTCIEACNKKPDPFACMIAKCYVACGGRLPSPGNRPCFQCLQQCNFNPQCVADKCLRTCFGLKGGGPIPCIACLAGCIHRPNDVPGCVTRTCATACKVGGSLGRFCFTIQIGQGSVQVCVGGEF